MNDSILHPELVAALSACHADSWSRAQAEASAGGPPDGPPRRRPRSNSRLARWMWRAGALLALAGALLAAAGCRDDMVDQPRYEPLEPSRFFDDGLSSRPAVPGTVARGQLLLPDALHTGRVDGALVAELPVALTPQLLARGRERFDIFCNVCHGQTGQGDGMIVRRGFRAPPTYHSARLRGAPVGHFFDVITHGFGAMPSYAKQVPIEDRWAIVAYLRALQLSFHADAALLAPRERARLEEARAP